MYVKEHWTLDNNVAFGDIKISNTISLADTNPNEMKKNNPPPDFKGCCPRNLKCKKTYNRTEYIHIAYVTSVYIGAIRKWRQ